jgi:hypothetical protein
MKSRTAIPPSQSTQSNSGLLSLLAQLLVVIAAQHGAEVHGTDTKQAYL